MTILDFFISQLKKLAIVERVIWQLETCLSGCCRGLNKSDHCMVTVHQDKKSGHCREVANSTSGGLTVHFRFRKNVWLSCFKPKCFLPLKLLDCWRMLPQKLNLVHGKYGYVSKRGVFFVAAMNSHSGKVKTLLKSLVTLVYWFIGLFAIKCTK